MEHRAVATMPLRVRVKRANDTGEVSRIVGYFKTCSCGYRTRTRPSVAAATLELHAHRAKEHP